VRETRRTGLAVTATDVVAEREPEAVTAGAHWAGSAAEVAAEVGVVITVLPGAAEVTAVAGPLIAALAPRATWNRHAAPSPIPPVRVAAEAESGRAAVHRPDLDCRNVANPALSLRLPL
jgi:3-hydroxyisobutyrate dehydrogenase